MRPSTAIALDAVRVVLDPVGRVGRAAPVVVGERQPLGVPEQPPRKPSGQPLAGVRRSRTRRAKLLHLSSDATTTNRTAATTRMPTCESAPTRQHRVEEAGQRLDADHAVDRDRQRQRASRSASGAASRLSTKHARDAASR